MTTRGLTEGAAAEGNTMLSISIEAVEGPGKGACAFLAAGTLVVGSHPDSELVLQDPTVSRAHLELELLPGAVRARDLGSRNGTFYLGARVTEAVIPVGGSVRVGKTTLRLSPRRPEQPPVSEREELQGLIGRSLGMRRLFAAMERVATSEATVLVVGETGVGKDAVARALHALSGRQGPLVAFDCAAVGSGVLESELFGHARGAFTGADREHQGALERAGSGTLLLDEVGELPLELQPRLLRALESRTFRRVGDGTERPISCRMIGVTQRDLEAEARAGRFRTDLYFRLEVIKLEIPPLRTRVEDVPLLAAHFARKLCGIEVPLAANTLAALQCDPWPGNVRELRNAVERAVTLGAHEHPSRAEGEPLSFNEARQKLVDGFERDYLSAMLARHGGRVTPAAEEAKLSRSQFYRLLEKHQLA